MTVAEIMSAQPITVGMDATLREIDELFRCHRFHHVMVTNGKRLCGVISDRDLLHHVSPFARTAAEQKRDEATLELHAHQVMTRRMITTSPSADVLETGRTMFEKGISCLPVVQDGDHLVGVVTWKDVLRGLIG